MQDESENDVEKASVRHRMEPEARRAHIIDAAQRLFFARGWDDVTIADVLDEAGISKGGFYHHFTAKEDLLDSVVARFATEAFASAEAASAVGTGDALTRFNAFLADFSRWKAERVPQMKFLMDVMLRPGNDVLFGRITTAANEVAIPILRGIIVQGVEERAFSVPDIDMVAEAIMLISLGRRAVLEQAIGTARSGNLDGATALFDQRMMAEGKLIDRMLGLKEGSIVMSNTDSHCEMLRTIACS